MMLPYLLAYVGRLETILDKYLGLIFKELHALDDWFLIDELASNKKNVAIDSLHRKSISRLNLRKDNFSFLYPRS